MCFLGIDTSCYTSSIAIVDHNEHVIYDGRILLQVGVGNRGLRQSEAVFQHGNNLPKLYSEAMEHIQPKEIKCIGVSSKPRNIEGSYMPVFTAGYNLSKVVASTLRLPVMECSHQQGHILAGTWSIGKQYADDFLVYHISGGTTELLKVTDISKEIEIVGGTEDLNAGQYIDRVGVSLGLGFPCGKEMDNLCSENCSESVDLPISVKGAHLSFSGPETHVQRLIKAQSDIDDSFRAAISKSVFLNIAKSLEKTIVHACEEYHMKNVLMVGGVASNSIIREILQSSTKAKSLGIDISISKPQYSTDNAVGAALYAKRAYQDFGGLNEQF